MVQEFLEVRELALYTVLDIETVRNPDIDPGSLNDSTAGPPSCHCIVAASTMVIGGGPKYKTVLKSHGDESAEEWQILDSLLETLGEEESTVVTWGGRWFDASVLLWACYRYGIQAKKLFNLVGPRYTSLDDHFDLVEATSFFGATPRSKLLHACQAIGLPGKTDTDGSMVAELYDKGEIKRIRKYNCMDVAQTGLVLIRWLHTRGDYGDKSYNTIVKNIIEAAAGVGIDVKGWDRLVLKE